MPIYEYVCDQCDEPSEILLKSVSQKPRCPHCGSAKLARQFSTFAAHQGSSSQPQQCQAGADGTCKSGKCPMSRG